MTSVVVLVGSPCQLSPGGDVFLVRRILDGRQGGSGQRSKPAGLINLL